MKIFSTYSVKIQHYNHIFEKTAELYQAAVDFYISVCLQEWEHIVVIKGAKAQQMFVESLTRSSRVASAIAFRAQR